MVELHVLTRHTDRAPKSRAEVVAAGFSPAGPEFEQVYGRDIGHPRLVADFPCRRHRGEQCIFLSGEELVGTVPAERGGNDIPVEEIERDPGELRTFLVLPSA